MYPPIGKMPIVFSVAPPVTFHPQRAQCYRARPCRPSLRDRGIPPKIHSHFNKVRTCQYSGGDFFANVIVNGDLTEAGRRIFSTIQRFDFEMLPGDWQQTLLTTLPAMPGLQRLQLFNPGPRPYLEIDLITRTIREQCPDLITLEFSCDWPLLVDLFHSAGVWDSCKHLLIKIDTYESSEEDGLEEMIQQRLESRRTGRRLQDIHLWIHHDQSYSSRDYAIELRSVLPFRDTFVEYRNGYYSPYSSRHLAELNHLLRKHHYASIESLTAARLFP